MKVKIEVDAPLEVRLLDGTPQPVVLHNSTVTGFVVLTPDGPDESFTSLDICHRVGGTGTMKAGFGPPVVLLPPGQYSSDGEQRMPFSITLLDVPCIPSYEASAPIVVHSLYATVRGVARFVSKFNLSAAQPINVQVPPPPADDGNVPISVRVADGHVGGECTLELPNGNALPLGGTASARVVVSPECKPLKRVLVKLLAVEGPDGPGPRCVREVVVWSAEDGFEQSSLSDGADVSLDLTDGYAEHTDATIESVGPSIALTEVGGAGVEVKHWLRLVIEPEAGKEAWNTLDVSIRSASLVGARKGSLPTVPPREGHVAGASGEHGGEGGGFPWPMLMIFLVFILRPILQEFLGLNGPSQRAPSWQQQYGFRGAPGQQFGGGPQFFQQQMPGGGGMPQFGGRIPGFNAPGAAAQSRWPQEEEEEEEEQAEVWVDGKGWVKV